MKHFLRKKLFSGALLFLGVVILSGVAVVYAQNSLTIDKDIILSPGKVIRFPDSSTLDSASAIGGGGWTATSTKIYPQAATYVGIGTTNPTSPLYVVGTTTIAGVLQVGAGGAFTMNASQINRTDGFIEMQFAGGNGVRMFGNTSYPVVFAGDGSVGIGVTPGYKLDIADRIRIRQGSNGSAGIWITDSSGSGDRFIGSLDNTGTSAFGFWHTGAWRLNVDSSGRVGIGITNPTYKLQVAGQIYADEGTAAADIIANKIDGVTFDPVYTIEGKRYATYNPGMVGGVKEELSDVATLVATLNGNLYSYTIDLNNKEKGSDVWLFAHTIDVEKNGLKHVSVLLTPNFDGKVWYQKDEQNKKIVIFGIPNSKLEIQNSKLEISYRLTAPRFDAKDWTNYSSSDWEGLNLDTYYKNNK
ncbi:hypothetical protein C4565_07560 [Candidatus Parcubacteria bacterium]|jgi:hypothetical protein|nr:MAG: hypothetical protein C4565_07560 [Candidatus Parcubacteria bacterium]